MIHPARYSFIALTAWLVLAFIGSFWSNLTVLWQIIGVILALLAIWDAWSVWWLSTPRFQRLVAGSLPLGVWSEVRLQCYNPSRRVYRLHLFDDYPVPSELQNMPQNLRLNPKQAMEIQYRIRPQQRGATQFNGVFWRLTSPFGFWQRQGYVPLASSVRIYPNFASIVKYALFATENRLGALGIRKLQRRGEGLDFHQLREYRPGDVLRQVDWKATARQKKLISKEYQDERDQRVVFLLDCGRRMLTQDGELSHFDHTLNAILLLSYVALRQGDALGLMSFSGEHRWLAPRKGAGMLNVVLNTVYDLQPSIHASDYLSAANQVMLRLQKRALVVLVTNLRDEDSDELLPALRLLRKKHLVLLASLREQILTQVLEQPVNNFNDALRQAATQHYLHNRHHTHEWLGQHGIAYLDTKPEDLPVQMVNKYLDIKRRGAL